MDQGLEHNTERNTFLGIGGGLCGCCACFFLAPMLCILTFSLISGLGCLLTPACQLPF